MADHATVCYVNGGQLLAYINKFSNSVNVTFDGTNIEAMGYPRAWVSGDCVVSIASADATELTVSKINNTVGNMADYDENNPAPWAEYMDQITTLTVGNDVTSIGDHAFDGFTHLTTVTLPISIVTIGEYAFDGCTDLATANISEEFSLTTIGQYAFRNCSSLTSFTIPTPVTHIGIGAFHGCTGMENVYCWPEAEDLTWDVHIYEFHLIDEELFKPDFGTTLHVFATQYEAYQNKFKSEQYDNNCDCYPSKLNVTYFGDLGNFPYVWNQTNVTCTLTADGTFTITGSGAMDDPEVLQGSYTDPETGETISYTSYDHPAWFMFRNYIQTAIVEEGVTSISKMAFEGSAVSSVSLPSTLTLIDSVAFASCEQLATISIPDAVTTIEEGAFSASGITSVTIPSGITVIKNSTFDGCHDLATVTLPSTVTTIGDDAFRFCGFTSIDLPSGLTSFGDRAFFGASLTNITIPGTVTTMGSYIFANCESLASVTIEEGITTIGESMFEALINPLTHEYNNNVLTTVTLPSTLTTIGKTSFQGCNQITEITIPSQVTMIDDYAFDGCTSMTDVYCYPAPNTLTWNNGAYSFKEDQSTLIHVVSPYINEYQSNFAYNAGTGEDDATGVRGTFVGDISLDLTLYADQDNTETLSELEGFSANVTLEGVTFHKNGQWNLFTLPFTLAGSDLADNSIFGDETYPTIVRLNKNSTNYDESTGTLTVKFANISAAGITAGTPYLVKWDSGEDIVNPVFENVTLSATATTVNNSGNNVHFVGTFDPANLTIGSSQNLYLGSDGKIYIPAEGCNTVNAFAGYFMVDGNVSSYIFDNESGSFYIFVTEGDWNTAANWSSGAIPPAGSDVIIQENVTVPSNYTADAGNIVIMESKTLTIADGGQLKHSNAVHGTIQKNIVGYGDTDNPAGWYLIGAPLVIDSEQAVSSGMVDLVDGQADFDTHGIDLYEFNQDKEDEWKNMRNDLDVMGFNVNLAYLYARADDATLNFSTTADRAFVPTSEDASMTVLRSINTPEPEFIGWNLIRNPYTCNAYLASGRDFYRMSTDGDGIVLATDENGGKTIKPCEGFFVVVGEHDDEEQFPNWITGNTMVAQIQITTTEPQSNGAKGMMDIKVKREGKLADVARVRFGEGDRMGKLVFDENATLLSLRQDGKDYSVVHNEAQGEMPVSFKANRNGQYTLNVDPEGAEMDYLHLIDNLTGADIDLLQTPSYTFESKVTDYESRFKLVFSAKDEDGPSTPSTGSGTFAFVSNGNIIVNGEGMLQVVDMMGRVIVSRDGVHTVSTNGMTPGVYVLRLTNGDDVKTQKIVIE